MQSIKEIFKIGYGPSSSHTMGPSKAAKIMLSRYPQADYFEVILYGSLALTGKGHLTDKVLHEAFLPIKSKVIFDYTTSTLVHPNTMKINVYKNKELLKSQVIYSIGGGSIAFEGEASAKESDIYPYSTFNDTVKFIKEKKISLPEYILLIEGEGIKDYLKKAYEQMVLTIKSGINKSGVLPGELRVVRKAKTIFNKPTIDPSMNFSRKIFAYAFAVSEENASGNLVVTAPTCGSAGVLPSVLYAAQNEYDYSDEMIINALMVAGFVGDLVKTNASISGACAGCQAEIGTACAMTAAAFSYLLGSTIDQIEQAAEIALEHHLGLTCDPILGYVQIPCIERNAVCALRAVDSAKLIKFVNTQSNKISFDVVCKTMLETGKDINEKYRETSEGGLAKEYRK